LPSSCGLGVRRDSRAIAIAIPPASTARPASWPPISFGSSGTVSAASVTRTSERFGLTVGSPTEGELEDGDGETVGNRLDALPWDDPVPDMGGKVVAGNGSVAPGCGVVVLGGGETTTTSVADPLKDFAPFPVALAVS
jgi:hypothetical protein